LLPPQVRFACRQMAALAVPQGVHRGELAGLPRAEERRCKMTSVIASPWLTLEQAAEYAKVSGATLRREAKAKRLRAYKVGGRRCWRFRPEDIDQWLLAGEPKVAS